MTRAVDARTRRFLERQRLAHLATADAGGAPHVIPVCFALALEGQTVYIAIDEKPKRSGDPRQLRRLRNIAENPRVALVADVYDDGDWSRLGFVLLRATARIVEAPAGAEDSEHARALRLLREKYPQYGGMRLGERPLIAADITAVTTWGFLD
jgi:coenzyme F420-0:L-glutamate ligase / coenzyme F420-1:gamma-L-glutamate ligase